jgi:drug/metabolite transporter (DMT)-like permease
VTRQDAAFTEPSSSAASEERRGVTCMALGGFILGTMGVFLTESGQPAHTALWFRCAFGFVALTLWVVMFRDWRTLKVPRRSWAAVVGTCALMPLNWWLFFESLSHTSIAVATVVFHVQPLLVVLLAAGWRREPPTLRQGALVLIALVGLTLATGWHGVADAAQTWHDSDELTGVLLSLSAALSYAVVTLLARSVGVGAPALSWWQCLAGTLMIGPWMLGVTAWPDSGSSWAWLAGLGVIHTGLAYVVLYAGMARLPVSRVATLQFIYPLTAILADGLVYRRTLDMLQWCGALLLTTAILQVGRSVAPRASSSKTPRAEQP